MMNDLSTLEKALEYEFKDISYLKTALTHSSSDKSSNSERIEFLGDAVLELSVSEYIYKSFETLSEGQLTKLRAQLVCENFLVYIAEMLGLGNFLIMGKSEETTGGRRKNSILADAVEAVFGAIYLDGGLDAAQKVILNLLLKVLRTTNVKEIMSDYKSELQEYVQKYKLGHLRYTVYDQKGPPHDRTYYIRLTLNGYESIGMGHTKKEAEQAAARAMHKDLINSGGN